VVQVVQDALADAQNHPTVPLEQRRKSGLISLGGEAFQQLAIRRLFIASDGGQPADVPQKDADLCAAHGGASREDDSTLLLNKGLQGAVRNGFFPRSSLFGNYGEVGPY